MLFRPLPRAVTRPVSILILVGWVAVLAVLVNRSYIQASSATLATDLARYGSGAQWHGVYYRGEKIGFTVSQTLQKDDGFELEEDGRLQMAMLGATTAATIHTVARVDANFALHSFEFSLDPGTGPVTVRGQVNDRRLTLSTTTPSGTRMEERDLPEPPALSLNLSRKLANGGLVTGARYEWSVFDPATLRNAPVIVRVGKREFVPGVNTPIPAAHVEMEYAGLSTTSWVTDTGEVLREESPMGMITVRETPEAARAMAVSRRTQVDMLRAAAIVPIGARRIDEPRDVRRIRLQLSNADLSGFALNGVGQTFSSTDSIVEIRDPQGLKAERADPDAAKYLAPEAFIESDAPEIIAESEIAARGATDVRDRAEKITRYVNAILDKKPTVSLPSAREVLRTRVGDCNEHTALYVAMARAQKIPARIAVGMVYIHGAYYYHAWPEVYIDEGSNRGLWLPVDPTLNQFPADGTHLRLARGGLDKQTIILPLIGKLRMRVMGLEMAPNSTPILVGKPPADLGPLAIPIPKRESCCLCKPAPPERPVRGR
ncbi:MAG: transglutaminase domain-containing protein [Acidobacteria bacterium]|nr:transglutaminase domain-containing protein [Acidobacteriota bacterium]